MTGGGARTIRVIRPDGAVYAAEKVKDRYEAVIRAATNWGMQWSQLAKVARYEEVTV